MNYLCIISRVLNSLAEDFFFFFVWGLLVIEQMTYFFLRPPTNALFKSTHYSGKQGWCKTEMRQQIWMEI